MRHFNILFAFAFVLLTSCFTDEVDYVGYQPSSKGGIHIIGAVEDYDVKSVGTRAEGDDIADSYISEMTMFIFKDMGNNNFELIQGYSDAGLKNTCTSAINIPRGNPTFLIDTEEGILADLSGSTDSSEVFYDNTTGDLTSCHIYIVANAWHQLILKDDKGNRYIDNIKTLADLEAFVYNVDKTLAMPMIDEDSFRGFPMIGKQQGNPFNLHKEGNNDNNSVATIPLKKLYSKVRFTMQVNADQVVAGQTPKFKIDSVQVFNIPNKVRMGRKLDANGKPVYGDTNADDYLTEMGVTSTTTPSEYYHFTEKPFTIDKFNKRTISHSTSLTTDDVIEFSFYMPEHKVTPNTITYPKNITDDAKQYYKPAGVGQSRNGDGSISAAKIATFVRIHGSYTDHNGQILGVKYDIYLGQNNYDDFTVKRNQQLNNKLIITGLTNHKNAYPDEEGNISIDHRVEVSDRGFNLSMERTAILDAHFEVRPLDIELQAGASMTVTIPDAYKSWVAMEDDAAARSGKNSSLYVNTSTARKGVRKYFTTTLVSELNNLGTYKDGNGGTLFFENTTKETKTFRVWFYIDENPNVYDKTGATSPNGGTGGYTVSKEQYRVCPVQFVYNGTKVVKDEDTDEDVTVDVTKTETINFQQWNLWRVWAKDANGNPVRYYDIEHEEEYLNNYASDLQYGQTQDGMPWGLKDLQFSFDHRAMFMDKSGIDIFTTIVNWIVEQFSPEYDYYLLGDIANANATIHHLPGYTVSGQVDGGNSGRVFFNEIIAENRYQDSDGNYVVDPNRVAIQDIVRTLTEKPESAVEYCNNKNYRDASTGKVSTHNWYLPSIDEMQEIAVGAYDEFNKVFQNNFYWSSQPAYVQQHIHYDVLIHRSGSFMTEDQTRARATKVYVAPNSAGVNEWKYTESGVTGYYKRNYINGLSSSDFHSYDVPVEGYTYSWTTVENWRPVTKKDFVAPLERQPGCKLRTESCRIRAVYRSGKI